MATELTGGWRAAQVSGLLRVRMRGGRKEDEAPCKLPEQTSQRGGGGAQAGSGGPNRRGGQGQVWEPRKIPCLPRAGLCISL